ASSVYQNKAELALESGDKNKAAEYANTASALGWASLALGIVSFVSGIAVTYTGQQKLEYGSPFGDDLSLHRSNSISDYEAFATPERSAKELKDLMEDSLSSSSSSSSSSSFNSYSNWLQPLKLVSPIYNDVRFKKSN
ncbi:hypothetical protein, partial [Silvanigrella paludirubra]|uniref:hypothetical protein n=1 Tax=Silvanigrella paludirubra TaxID=2499159 RepID=UPI001386C0D5